MMAAESEECELQQLVPPDDDTRVTSKSGEVTPPVTAGVSKVTQTSPTSPDSNKVSNNNNYNNDVHISLITCMWASYSVT